MLKEENVDVDLHVKDEKSKVIFEWKCKLGGHNASKE